MNNCYIVIYVKCDIENKYFEIIDTQKTRTYVKTCGEKFYLQKCHTDILGFFIS